MSKTRKELEIEAREIGVDPTGFRNKTELHKAIDDEKIEKKRRAERFLPNYIAEGDLTAKEEKPDTEEVLNAPPLELSDQDIEDIDLKQEQEETYINEVRGQSKTYSNGKNDWKLISKTYNNKLDYNHTTMAMRLGNRGILVCVTEALNAKTTMTMAYVDNGKLVEKDIDGELKWVLE